MNLHLTSSNDLPEESVSQILGRAAELAAGASPMGSEIKRVATFFLEPSLRTRAGFAAAGQRLGWPHPIEVLDRRASDVSMPESLADTISVLSAYVDILIMRLDRPISTVLPFVAAGTKVINAGDRGRDSEHPTQALIDLFAMQSLVGNLSTLRVALCGDLRMRSARSLLCLLARHRPAELVLITDPSLMDDLKLPVDLGPYQLVQNLHDALELDALHAMGIPHGGTDEGVRRRLRVDRQTLSGLSGRGRVFSPMPVIDEVAHSVRTDERVSYLQQSSLGLHVRTAILEYWGALPSNSGIS